MRTACRTVASAAIALVLLGAPHAAAAAAPVQRFTLVIGANFGGADRPRLQYAVSDAERFARVLVDLGGVTTANEIVLRQPKLRDLLDALDLLNRRVVEARRAAGAAGGRTEVLLYYSGHADEQGLLVGDDRYSYRSLRDRLDQIPADVRIAVLDACASGAFTRLKGGRARPAFLVDESADMRGHAFLTSSAETEAAQESDRIRASYFTHYLISGFRGAADLSGDGKITLNEAYQFAFNETLGRTVDTKGGAQHPSYDINMSGTGDIVMTDVRQTSATLVLGEDLDGRFFIRNAAHELVVELFKPRGRKVELGIEPGAYEVRVELAKGSLLTKTQVDDGARVVLEARQFGPAAVEATRRRGGFEAGRFPVAGRNQLEVRWGMWNASRSSTTGTVGNEALDAFAGVQYAYYLGEHLAVTFGIEAVGTEQGATVGTAGTFAGTAGVVAMPVGIRWNPFKGERWTQSAKPFLAFGIGPVFGVSSGAFVTGPMSFAGSRVQTTPGGHVGAGVDFHVAQRFSLGVHGGYNWMLDYTHLVGSHTNFSGPELGVGLGWVFGRGRAHTR